MIGTRLAHYEILGLLGKGGMGEVYRARDGKLDRDVAIKLLPPEVAADPDRFARFRREAKLLASLNHANIATIHGLESIDGRHFLVMEIAEGEDLAARIARGPVPLDEALDIARQLAEGLEEAHEKGIVHRDLKPANVMVSAEGKVKILDFGLARAFVGEEVNEGDPLHSPTITTARTQQGLILGTAAYMSPEQARGRPVDRRADLWSFGVILWEMLTGKRLFEGETVSDTLAAVLRAEPAWEELPPETPEAVQRLLRRCLERDPRKRLRDIGEARVRLERWKADPDTLHETESAIAFADTAPAWRRALPWVLAGMAAIAAVVGWLPRPAGPASSQPSLHLQIQLDDQAELQTDTGTNVFFSPRGDELAYIAGGTIHLRRLDQSTTRVLSGTDGALIACYSPDGQWIAFTAAGQLMRVNVTGGSPVAICDAPDTRGICWLNESTLVFTPNFSSGLVQVSLSDGIIRPLTTLDSQKGERSHRWPQALPDGRSVLFQCQYFGRHYDESDIQVVSLDDPQPKTVYRGGSSPRYVSSGHLLFARNRTIFAIPLDLATLKTSGLAAPILDNVWTSVGNQEIADGSAQFDVSPNGLLIYRTATELDRRSQLAWFDLKTGDVEPFGSVAVQNTPVLSPDSRRLLVARGEDANADLFVIDLETNTEARFTFADGADIPGAWSPDGTQIYYSRPNTEGSYVIYRKAADGSGSEKALTRLSATTLCDAVSPDGRWLLLSNWGGASLWDIDLLDLQEPDSTATRLIGGAAMQFNSRFSPDGQWVAYVQSQSTNTSVFVRHFPDTGARWQVYVGTTAIQDLAWSSDGGALYVRDGVGYQRIGLKITGQSLQASPPRLLRADTMVRNNAFTSSSILADGTRAVVLVADNAEGSAPTANSSRIVLVTHWLDALKQKVPTGR